MKRSFIIIFVAASMLAFTRPAQAQVADVPLAIPYEGHLTDAGGMNLNADVQIEVRLYDSVIAGLGQGVSNLHVVYAEMHPTVTVEGGNFRIGIGEGTPLDAKWTGLNTTPLIEKENVYLELWINGERLNPRQRLGSIPAATKVQHAKYADELVNMPEITEAMMPTYPASKITSGIFLETQIPNLPASRITGMLAAGQLPEIPISKFSTAGASFDMSQLGNLTASKITSGTVELDRLPQNTYLTTEEFTTQLVGDIGGKSGDYYALPSGFGASDCLTIFSPVDARPVEGIDRLDMWMNPSGTLYCTVNEKPNNDQSDNTLEDCKTLALTLCKTGGF
jgi:hypothetical protein